MPNWWYHACGGTGWFGPAIGLGIVLIAGIVLLAIALVRRGSKPQAPDPTAMHVLEERFARGEIDTEEFEQRRDILRRAAENGTRRTR
ncbi:SHOCT domain-containing protein [Amycolatopsis sp. CA-230715]|uniref:SHOCT domain-containing protein n=1 Tax=Amycolatopsis sp. CA-230715 TaxID=2745196 RepID=UPI001C031B7B|nr:SHOCT domain-containing protein [Amycolatopsis sp. CA-230715]QWF77961.1 hypothetical protein HUW46_01354 [Amycolatopsis sp. CA-230715]